MLGRERIGMTTGSRLFLSASGKPRGGSPDIRICRLIFLDRFHFLLL